MTTQQINNNRLVLPRTCDIISHGLLIRITVPSKKFPPVEHTPNPTVTLYQSCHYYTNGHVLTGQLVLQGPALGKTTGVSFLLGRLHRTFWNYESQPVGRKFPAQFEIDFSMSYNQSIQCLQQCGLTMQLQWATKDNGNNLCHFGDLWDILDQ